MTRREASNCVRDHTQSVRTAETCQEGAEGREEGTYTDSCCLSEEANKVEAQLAMRRKGNAGRDHEDDDGQFAVGFLDVEGPGDEEDGHGRKRLPFRR